MIRPICKITVFGPRAHDFGGHDKYSQERESFRHNLTNIFHALHNKYEIIGLTSLSTAADLEFAQACLSNKIPYKIYSPFANQELTLPNSFEIRNRYFQLFGSANDVIMIKGGAYSLKKIKAKNLKLINDADLILVKPSQYRKNYDLIKYAILKRKQVVII